MKDETALIPTIEGAPTQMQVALELKIKEFSVDDQRKALIIQRLLPQMLIGEPLLIKGDALIEEVGDAEPTKEQEKAAYEVRNKLVKVRTGSKDAKKEGKDASLNEGRAWDGAYNFIESRVSSTEDKLKAIETYSERKEAARVEALGVARRDELAAIGCDKDAKVIAKWDEDTYQAVLTVEKQKYEARMQAEAEEAERVAEADRQEKERIARITLGNTRIYDAGKEGVIIPIPAIEAGAMGAAEWLTYFGNLYLQKQESDRIAAEEKAAKDAEAEKARNERDAMAKKLKEETDRLLAEQEKLRKETEDNNAKIAAEQSRIAEEQRKKDLEAQRILEAQQEEARAAREAAARLQAEADARAKAEREAAEALAKAGDAEKLAIIQAKIAAVGKELGEMSFVSDAAILAKAATRAGLETAWLAAKL
jgi:hypothetical protein